MWKYRSQTLISLIGLAVGFACFALATLWIRYEMTFDNFHKHAKHLYVVYSPDIFSPTGYGRRSPNQLAAYLKETFPEIADAAPVIPAGRTGTVTVEGVDIPAKFINADSSFLRIFDVKILEGSREFLIVGGNKIAITREKARQFFGDENPIGKTVSSYEICAVVSDMPKRSNYAFDLIRPFFDISPGSRGENTIIES